MNAIVISDLHIGSQYLKSRTLEDFLEAIPKDHEIIMNGDIIDQPYLKMTKSDQRILDRIEQISLGQKVVWIQGNHDNGYTPSGLGKVKVTRSYSIGKRLLITHGDDFDDIMPRSRTFIRAFKLMHALRVKLGAKPVHVAEYAKKWKSFYNVLRKNIASNAVSCAIENGFEAVTCGHTHYPEDMVVDGIRYINTGAWTELPAHYLYVTGDDITLNTVDLSCVIHNQKSPQLNQMATPMPFQPVSSGSAETGRRSREIVT
ncbi:MAG: UDP-2,3-diacylglucosamine diphosphatase [Desulfobacterales bacterium]|jgi:UDP-2,3-diacylglucosamine pyrophosphatase LpxH